MKPTCKRYIIKNFVLVISIALRHESVVCSRHTYGFVRNKGGEHGIVYTVSTHKDLTHFCLSNRSAKLLSCFFSFFVHKVRCTILKLWTRKIELKLQTIFAKSLILTFSEIIFPSNVFDKKRRRSKHHLKELTIMMLSLIIALFKNST